MSEGMVKTEGLSGEADLGVDHKLQAMGRLVAVVRDLSLTRDMEAVMRVVRLAARELTGADGATFVLRDGEHCYYAEENAIAPLWKGHRFPMQTCISGWVMLNGQVAVIPDIYQDERIPQDAYRPTFVKSLAMVPIRAESPIGAIGNYWAEPHVANPEELELLQSLADTTSVALENIQLYADLEKRVEERTRQLETANKELEAFSYSVSHDLRAPLRSVEGFSRILAESEMDRLTPEGQDYLARICASSHQMGQLIEGMLSLSRLTREGLLMESGHNLSEMAAGIARELQEQEADRSVVFEIEPGVMANGDQRMLHAVLQNLLGNAWKYTAKNSTARIQFGKTQYQGLSAYFVKDDGAGFNMEYAKRLFGAFQRLHAERDFPGTGIGLAIVARIIHRHGGEVWADAAEGQGATFYFTLEPIHS